MHFLLQCHHHSGVIYSLSIHRLTCICHECWGEEHISHNGGHLALECLAAGFPSLFLIIQTLQQGNTSLYLKRSKSMLQIFFFLQNITNSLLTTLLFFRILFVQDILPLQAFQIILYQNYIQIFWLQFHQFLHQELSCFFSIYVCTCIQIKPHLCLHVRQVCLDGLGLTDQQGVLLLVAGYALLQAGYSLVHLLRLLLVLLGLCL